MEVQERQPWKVGERGSELKGREFAPVSASDVLCDLCGPTRPDFLRAYMALMRRPAQASQGALICEEEYGLGSWTLAVLLTRLWP